MATAKESLTDWEVSLLLEFVWLHEGDFKAYLERHEIDLAHADHLFAKRKSLHITTQETTT